MGKKILLVYIMIGIFTALYGYLWGDYHYQSLGYHLGRGLVWPAVWFPSLSKAIGAVLFVAIIAIIGIIQFIKNRS